MLGFGIHIPFSSVRVQIFAALLVAFPFAARAGECPGPHPDYKAERIVTVGDSRDRMTVYVSGALVREERSTPEGMSVTIRDLGSGRTTVFNPHTGRSMVLPSPRGRPRSVITRTLDEAAANGMHVYVVQFLRDAAWQDVSRTRCRQDGIMTRQTFISLDPRGQEVEGILTQDQIEIGPLSTDLFRMPPSEEPDRPGHN
jgi:hypothetical protein